MALRALWERDKALLQDSDSMRKPGSNGVASVTEVVVIKDLLVKDPLGSLYYVNNGSSQLYCFHRSPSAQRRKGPSQGNAGYPVSFSVSKGGVDHTSFGIQVNLVFLLQPCFQSPWMEQCHGQRLL